MGQHRPRVPAVSRRRRPRSRGQALIEFTMFVLFLITMTAGVVDIGGLLNDHISLEYAARQGARTGSVLGNAGSADCAVIGAVDAALVDMPNLTLTRIVIYDAGPNGQVYNGLEDVYQGNTTCTVVNGVATISPAATTMTYPPAQRNNTPYTEDSIGVELDYNYKFSFGFALLISGTFSASDYAVMPINPIAIPSPVPTPTPLPTPTP
jgi:Flp pilus assembly protein TadG